MSMMWAMTKAEKRQLKNHRDKRSTGLDLKGGLDLGHKKWE